jgi:uncharacterized protein YqkB
MLINKLNKAQTNNMNRTPHLSISHKECVASGIFTIILRSFDGFEFKMEINFITYTIMTTTENYAQYEMTTIEYR